VITSELAAAARNNAVWCDTVCRAHGRPGEFLPGLWVDRHPAPRFYPNAITLGADEAAVVARLYELGRAGLPPGWGVKDSFCTLDLTPLGFRVLFDAEWIWRPAARSVPPPGGGLAGAHWARIRTQAELAGWEAAWGSASEEDRLFPPLLAYPAIAFLAAYRAGEIIAGAIANQSDDVVGLGNTFGPTGESAGLWAGIITAARQAFPGLPLAGYEAGADLAAAQSAGCAAIGPLRVWVSDT
jgi:hypothetical protein